MDHTTVSQVAARFRALEKRAARVFEHQDLAATAAGGVLGGLGGAYYGHRTADPSGKGKPRRMLSAAALGALAGAGAGYGASKGVSAIRSPSPSTVAALLPKGTPPGAKALLKNPKAMALVNKLRADLAKGDAAEIPLNNETFGYMEQAGILPNDVKGFMGSNDLDRADNARMTLHRTQVEDLLTKAAPELRDYVLGTNTPPVAAEGAPSTTAQRFGKAVGTWRDGLQSARQFLGPDAPVEDIEQLVSKMEWARR